MPTLGPATFVGHIIAAPAQKFSGKRGRGQARGRYVCFRRSGTRNAIEEFNETMDALQTTKSRPGRIGFTAKQACSNTNSISAEILQAMQALESLPPGDQFNTTTQNAYKLDSTA
ncbi:hypothetical protein BWQ96_03667 [Gracilariopsis chorda]|uniref:Uncharacterized protein n=1 Tax=Gracilariopsis chorda TaxID=448386 RepID=A0A2V3IWR0_9FLOR|nr:hypothetical protein BWQ96_03667 [Gracilariopsis chorda]|eukprot:PXF46539.1 hypothetical protein BWQ96_03667 [Gracilariopsis chorda]